MASANGWKYFEHRLASGITSVTVSGSVTIDGLRLYPSDAQMTSYTYSPLVGMTSSADAGSHISYYLYDALGRMTAIKDQDGNVIKTIQYHYKGQALP
jgi:YD repeat-containing protein